MKKIIILSIITLGFSSIISQVLIIRELTISFYGNEFFIGWIFFSWLFWVGIGSLFLNKIIKKNITKTLIICHILIPILLLISVFFIRISKIISLQPTGQIPNLLPSLIFSFLIIAPLCLFLGLQFVIISRIWKKINKNKLSKSLGKSYILESLGFILGGLIFTYLLIYLNEFLVLSIIGWINLLICMRIVLLKDKLNLFLKRLIIVLIILFISLSFFSNKINKKTNSLRYPSQQLIESKNSIYGNIAITKIKEQYNFYESGLLLGSNKEEAFAEYISHFSLLYHPNPKKILLIGGGFNETIKELQKHQLDQIYYLELDPVLIKMVNNYIDLREVKIINQDVRYFLKTNSEKFDIIIVNIPNPSTALINRLYTNEFIKESKNHLEENGILSTYISSSPNYLDKITEDLDASIFKTLKQNFSSIIILPEDNHFFIASQMNLEYNPEILINRLKQRNIKNNFVNEKYIEYRLTNTRTKQIVDAVEKNKEAKINQDKLPISYYYNFTYWISIFHPKIARTLHSFNKLYFIWIIIFPVLSILLILLLQKDQTVRKKSTLILLMGVGGFSLLTIKMIIIFAFQIFYGYLYYKIALIITVLMIGMTIGGWLGVKKIKKTGLKTLIIVNILILIFIIILIFGFNSLFRNQPKPSIIMEVLFLLIPAIIGGLISFEFPIINKLYLSKIKNPRKKAGTIYGTDLIGSCIGAILISIFLIPLFGIINVLIFLVFINLAVLIPTILLQRLEQ